MTATIQVLAESPLHQEHNRISSGFWSVDGSVPARSLTAEFLGHLFLEA